MLTLGTRRCIFPACNPEQQLQRLDDYLDYARVQSSNNAIVSTNNYVTGAAIVDGVGVFFVDVIEDDALYPCPTEDSVCSVSSA